MATHTETTTFSGRKFNIARKNGQVDKEGEPYFFEWLNQAPTGDPGKRIFEQRTRKSGDAAHYELFKKVDGYFVNAVRREVNYGDKSEECVLVFMVDGSDDYTIDLGRFDGRYAMDFLKRILDPRFDATQRLSLSPYAIKKDNSDGYNIGVSVYSGPNKMDASYQAEHLAGMPQGEKEENRKGDVTWYYDKAANWLWDNATTRVFSKMIGDPVSFKQPVRVPLPSPETVLQPSQAGLPVNGSNNYFPTEAPPVDHMVGANGDDLPF